MRAWQLRKMGLNPTPFIVGGPDAADLRARIPGLDPNGGTSPFTPYEAQRMMSFIDEVQPPGYPDTISRAQRPTADVLSVLGNPDLFASPDFAPIEERWTGKTRNVSPGGAIVQGSRPIYENPPLLANTGPGAALRDPRTGELVSQNDYGPRTVGANSDLVTLDADGNVISRTSGPAKQFSPNAGAAKPVDPVLDANRRATLAKHARAEVLAEEGIQEVPGAGLIDTSTGRAAFLTPDRIKSINQRAKEREAAYLGRAPAQPAPSLGEPTGLGQARTMPDNADPENDSYSPAGSVATEADAQRALEQANGDPTAARAILLSRGLRRPGQ